MTDVLREAAENNVTVLREACDLAEDALSR